MKYYAIVVRRTGQPVGKLYRRENWAMRKLERLSRKFVDIGYHVSWFAVVEVDVDMANEVNPSKQLDKH